MFYDTTIISESVTEDIFNQSTSSSDGLIQERIRTNREEEEHVTLIILCASTLGRIFERY